MQTHSTNLHPMQTTFLFMPCAHADPLNPCICSTNWVWKSKTYNGWTEDESAGRPWWVCGHAAVVRQWFRFRVLLCCLRWLHDTALKFQQCSWCTVSSSHCPAPTVISGMHLVLKYLARKMCRCVVANQTACTVFETTSPNTIPYGQKWKYLTLQDMVGECDHTCLTN